MNPMLMMMLGSGLLGGLSSVGGKKGKFKSTFSPGARDTLEGILNDIKNMKGGAIDVTKNPQYQQGNEWLMSMFNDPEFFKSFEAPLQRQFQEQTIPDLANRFASMGSGGSLGSTGFRNQLAREGSNLATNIAALRGGMQQSAIPQLFGSAQQPFSNLMQLLGVGTQPTQNVYQPPSAGPFGNIFASLTGGLSQGLGPKLGQMMV